MKQIGISSGRPFNPSQAGGRILSLSYQKVKITHKGIDKVKSHILRFNPPGGLELQMIERLKRIANSEIGAEAVDLRFYTHELREYLRYKKIGYATGQPSDRDEAYQLWNNAHTATLEDYKLKEGYGVLFHPSLEEIS
ncbi:MAG TPA: hypothetical protein DEG17_21720 [Cyanobacteria bacterium UBA11149]|nr:hypothetical protein [Cyanobacteria bacterium UBA11367]HBE57868.1 hypothetical protein [Cyanobacteria bacterium UBA11366]HBK65478.1 hypothetical protein [Cyanobacteria bacterium UBA11166]HBR72475.1 hypothetical protein [Cyanobacteria bacterium UBA11159]HBS68254.1 hypothetical protein [Cyanobacteria bacterium UBA11153]HBW91405.1 hypothetical protein [Cyanobacteria bacterium UBA11149]HCA96793.1 hypothetical protein [Cyanobacteria bacterium UBA9226]